MGCVGFCGVVGGFVELRGYKKNDPSVEGSLSVPFIVQYADRNLQVDCILRRIGTNIF